jgi:hypothetical protein
MAICPFAEQKPISGSSGSYLGGPFKIVHHTTEGTTADAAFAAFHDKKADPHFTVDRTTIYQHIDTGVAARALRHPAGTPETNRDSAVQIELVGFAGAQKDARSLANVARLCRWIEATHHVARIWPSGPPRPPHNGGDPGGHTRDQPTWDGKSGHYGHSQVPNNTHWDPAYSALEAAFVLAAEFDALGHPTNRDDPAVAALAERPLPAAPDDPVVMTDHDDDAGEPVT